MTTNEYGLSVSIFSDNTKCAIQEVCVTIPGDVDGDFDVDILDVVKITGIYASKHGDPQFNPNSDIDNDGVITILDVVICTSHYAKNTHKPSFSSSQKTKFFLDEHLIYILHLCLEFISEISFCLRIF